MVMRQPNQGDLPAARKGALGIAWKRWSLDGAAGRLQLPSESRGGAQIRQGPPLGAMEGQHTSPVGGLSSHRPDVAPGPEGVACRLRRVMLALESRRQCLGKQLKLKSVNHRTKWSSEELGKKGFQTGDGPKEMGHQDKNEKEAG